MNTKMIKIYIDADGCPVKEEIYRVAGRYSLNVLVVANKAMKIPLHPLVKMIVVKNQFDAADDWITESIEKNNILVTTDILLAKRCIDKSARVLTPKGHEYDEENIGEALQGREIASFMRETGEVKGGGAPMGPKDRSFFLSKLDQVIQSIKKSQ